MAKQKTPPIPTIDKIRDSYIDELENMRIKYSDSDDSSVFAED